MGQIRKRGRIYWIRYYSAGQRIEESAETTSYDDARDLLKKREGAIADGVPLSRASVRYTFDEAVAEVVADYMLNKRKSTDWVQRRIDKHLSPAFKGRRLSSIHKSDLRAFAVRRQEAGASAAEVNRELAIIRRAYRLASEDKYHGRIPKFPMLMERNTRQGFFEDEQLEAVIGKLRPALRPVIRFAALTGWRVNSEVLTLTWAQVDRDRGEVRLEPHTTKNREGRVFLFTTALRELIDGQWAERETLQKAGTICPWVFHRGGKKIKDFRGAWRTSERGEAAERTQDG